MRSTPTARHPWPGRGWRLASVTPTGRRTRTAVAWGDPPGRQCRVGRSPPAPFGGDAFAGDDAEGVAQDRDLAQEAMLVRPQADQFGLPGVAEVPSCSWRRSWRAWAIQSRQLSMLMPSSRATWLTGTLRDRVSRTAWWRNPGEYGATYGRMIGMGRSTTVAVAGPGWSRLVGGGRSRSLCGYRHGDNASTGHDVSLPG